MAYMFFYNTLEIPVAGSPDGKYYVKKGDTIEAWIVSDGIPHFLYSNRLDQIAWGQEIMETQTSTNWTAGMIGNRSMWQEYESKCGRYLLKNDGSIRCFPSNEAQAVKAVNKALRRCIKGIEELDPELGSHFREQVKTWNQVMYLG